MATGLGIGKTEFRLFLSMIYYMSSIPMVIGWVMMFFLFELIYKSHELNGLKDCLLNLF